MKPGERCCDPLSVRARLREENAELGMERNVLKRSPAVWLKDPIGSRLRGRFHRGPKGGSRRPSGTVPYVGVS